MSFIPRPHEIYQHFKGNLYQVTAIAEHTETGEQLVIYQDLYDQSRIYARPLLMFISKVDRDKYPDAEQEFRFQLQGPEAGRQKAQFQEAAEGKRTDAPGSAAYMTGAEGKEGPVQKAGQADGSGLTGDGLSAQEEEVPDLDPFVLEFLDSDSYEQRLNILAGLHHRITDEMITTMAIACDIEINDGDIEERYEALKTCLLTLERYECNRLR
nr:DUF1653 domain-containing protein [uncultured Acetatifactor sp.]